jgi:putative Ca2+/H+ antiporter (TMEM165/GDT1 family)
MTWSALFSTFGIIFIAELGDKTQLAVMTQTCKYRCPMPVFFGASLALTLVTALGAAGGKIVGHFIPAEAIRAIAGMAFVVMGALMFREALGKDDPEDNACACETDESAENSWWNWKAFVSTLTLLFFAELGDKTQLAVLGLSGKDHPLSVFVGGAAALISVTALGVIGGQQLCRLIPEKVLLRLSAGLFIIMGILIGWGIV